MKVFHIESGLHLYGGPRQVAYLLEQLHHSGIENVLYCPQNSDIGRACSEFATVITAPSTGLLGPIRFINGLSRALESEQPDLLHVHSRRLAIDFFAGLVAKAQAIPAILSRRVDNPEDAWSLRYKYRLFRQTIAISEGIRQVLLSQGLAAEQVVTVRSAVDAGRYSPGCDREAFLHRFGLPGDSLVIGVVAQLIERKGHRHLLTILPQLLQQHPNLQVLFFGKGALAESLQARIDAEGLSRHVQLVGFIDDLPDCLGCLDLLVHPADMEGLGVSLLQAAACGVPVIASRAGGMPEAVADHLSGLLVEPGNTTELQAAVLQLLGDEALRKQYGHYGRAMIESQFSTAAMAAGNLAVYRRVLDTSA